MTTTITTVVGPEARADIVARLKALVRDVVMPCETDTRRDHCPTEQLVTELKETRRQAGVLTPNILPDDRHLSQRETVIVLKQSGLSPLEPSVLNMVASDEGNMCLLGKVGGFDIKQGFVRPVVEERARSAFLMTEPATEGVAGSEPSMMRTTCLLDGSHCVSNGHHAFPTGANGTQVGIVMAKSEDGACLFLVDLPDPAICVDHVPNTIDSSMPGSDATVTIDDLRVPADQSLEQSGRGFRYAQIPLAPARLSHRMRWLGLHPRRRDRHPLRLPAAGIRQDTDRPCGSALCWPRI